MDLSNQLKQPERPSEKSSERSSTQFCSIVICGYDELSALTIQSLMEFGQKALVIDPKTPDTLPDDTQYIQADYRSSTVLKQIGIEQAKVVLLLKDDDQGNFETALLIRELNSKARIISRLFNRNLAKYFDQNIINHFSLSTSTLVAPAFGLKAVSDEFIGYFALPSLQEQDPNAADTTLWNVVDLAIRSDSGLLRLSLEELANAFQIRVLFHYPVDQLADFSAYRVFEDFDHQAKLAEGDRVVLICSSRNYLRLLERNGRKGSSRAQQWAAGQMQKQQTLTDKLQRLVQRVWRWRPSQINPLGRFLSFTLVGMLILGVGNFVAIGKNPADALFLTITVLSGGYGDISDFQDPVTPVLVKLLAVLLALVGTALVGLVYGFVTDKLLSSRFGLGKAGIIPRADHVVIAGLGRLGYRILQLLRQMNYEVVVIEGDEDNPLIEAARQEGVAVLVGNSTLPSTLTQANLANGRCLICTVDDDLANLETALTAHTLNSALRTILRISDPQVANRIQRHFQQVGINYSPASLAAPAFATAALVGSVYGTISWQDQTLLVTVLDIAAQSPYLGLPLREFAYNYDLVLLAAQLAGQAEITFPKIWEDQGDYKLNSGDCFYILTTFESLSRLARQRPLPAEVYRVKLIEIQNAYFEKDIAEAIAFYCRQPLEEIKPLLQNLPVIVSPPIPKDRALKLAQQLKKMRAQVAVIADVK